MNVLLINPPKLTKEIYNIYSYGAPILPPLGLCYLATALLKDRHKVKIIDAAAERIRFNEIKKEIIDFSPAIVGITSTTASYKSACKIIYMIKRIDRNITTILGGAHVSSRPYETILECEDLDIAVINEGEHTIREVAKTVEEKKSLSSIKGIYYRKEGNIIANYPREFEDNIDIFSFPKRELLKSLRLYHHAPTRSPHRLATSMITSRGCPFRCSFCQQSIFGRRWRGHSPAFVVDEMRILTDEYKVKFISIEDDNFAFDRNRVMEICRRIINNRITVEWGCSVKIDSLDSELLRAMRGAGCKNIYIGIESSSDRILNLYQKRDKRDKLINVINMIKKMNFNLYGAFILGAPTETINEMNDTIRFAVSLPLDGVSFSLFVPYPNTILRNLAFRKGTVSEDWDNYSGHSPVPAYVDNGFTPEKIVRIQKLAYLRFYFRLKYIIKHLKLILRKEFIFKAVHILSRFIFKF